MKALFVIVALCVTALGASSVAWAESNGEKSIEIRWAVDVDQRKPNAPAAFSAVAIVPNKDKLLIVIGGRDRWVHVYDLDGGEHRRIALQAPSDSGALALPNGLVVLGDIAGRMYAIDPEQGNIVWQRQLTASFTSIPVALGDGFLVQTTDNRMYRFSQDGEKLWSFSGQNSVLSMYLNSSPLIVGENVYAVFSNGDAVALKAANGDVLWKRQLLLSNDSAVLSELKAALATPIFVPQLNVGGEKVSEAIVLAFFQGNVLALTKEDGIQAVNLPISLKSAPVILENMLYMADSKGYLHAYDIQQGTRLWRKQITQAELAGLTFWQNAFWLSDNKGMVFRVSRSGDVQAAISLDGNIIRLPQATEQGLLLRSNLGVLYMVQ